jgi:hypothetical protein
METENIRNYGQDERYFIEDEHYFIDGQQNYSNPDSGGNNNHVNSLGNVQYLSPEQDSTVNLDQNYLDNEFSNPLEGNDTSYIEDDLNQDDLNQDDLEEDDIEEDQEDIEPDTFSDDSQKID